MEAMVVVLKQPSRDSYEVPKSYSPIGLLLVLGKLYERMLIARLKFKLLPRMSTRQYGFIPQRSTKDSLYDLMEHIRTRLGVKKIVTMVPLDIDCAFDSAWWPAFKIRLAEEMCPVNLRRASSSYLADRIVRVRYAGGECCCSTENGCVQGPIGGLLL